MGRGNDKELVHLCEDGGSETWTTRTTGLVSTPGEGVKKVKKRIYSGRVPPEESRGGPYTTGVTRDNKLGKTKRGIENGTRPTETVE